MTFVFTVHLHFPQQFQVCHRMGIDVYKRQLYWQVKSDVMIKGADVLRAGVVLGVKLPVK